MQHDQSKLFPFCCYCGLTALTFAPRVPCSPLQFHIYDDLQMCCSVPWARWGEQGVCKAGKRSMPGIAGSPYGWGSCRQDEGRKTADIPLSQRQPELSSQGIRNLHNPSCWNPETYCKNCHAKPVVWQPLRAVLGVCCPACCSCLGTSIVSLLACVGWEGERSFQSIFKASSKAWGTCCCYLPIQLGWGSWGSPLCPGAGGSSVGSLCR